MSQGFTLLAIDPMVGVSDETARRIAVHWK